MQWTKALSVNLRRRERKTRNNEFGGNLDVGSVTLNMDFFPQFTCLHTNLLTIITAVKWGTLYALCFYWL